VSDNLSHREIFVLEIPHRASAFVYEIEESQLAKNVAHIVPDVVRDLGYYREDLTLDEVKEVMMVNLHSVYFFRKENEIKEFINDYKGHQHIRCSAVLENLLWDHEGIVKYGGESNLIET